MADTEDKQPPCRTNAASTTRGNMNIHRNPTPRFPEADQDHGFTLVEILIAVVLIGILSAVAVVAISSLVSKGSTSACNATLDSSKAASAVYFASNANTYPINFTQLTTATGTSPNVIPAALTLPSGVAVGASPFTTLTSGTSWTLTMTAGSGTVAPTFVCT